MGKVHEMLNAWTFFIKKYFVLYHVLVKRRILLAHSKSMFYGDLANTSENGKKVFV